MSKKDKVKEKKRAARLRARQAEELRLKELEEETVEDETDFDDEFDIDIDDEEAEKILAELDEDEPELKEASYDEGVVQSYNPEGGAVTWEQSDAIREAREKASKINQLAYTVEDLVWNIVHNQTLNPVEMGQHIKAVGDGFSERVQNIVDKPDDDMMKDYDIDLLELEALIAKSKREMTSLDKVVDFIEKKKLTSSARKKLPDSSFALPSKRKYPIHDKSHVRNALARAAQEIKAGGESAKDAKAALPKIRAAAKKFGIGMSKENLVVEKDFSGKWRWVGLPTNNYIDRDGEIISKAAHEEYAAWIENNPNLMPEFITWHTPWTQRASAIDFVGEHNGFLVTSGPLTEKEAAGLLKAISKEDIGLSHGTIVLERNDKDTSVIEKYRMYEVSDLPLSNAANPFTTLEALSKEETMNANKQAYLKQILGDEKADELIKRIDDKKEVLDAAGVARKEVTEETQPAEKATSETASETAPVTLSPEVIEQIGKSLELDGLAETIKSLIEKSEKVDALEEIIKELAGSRDEKIAEMINPPVAKMYPWSKNRPSQSNETLKKEDDPEDEKLFSQGPQVHWLSMATGTRPVQGG